MTWDNRQADTGGQPVAPGMMAMEPSVLNLFNTLAASGGASASGRSSTSTSSTNDDADVMNMIQGVMGQVVNAVSGQQRSDVYISDFLSQLPDYQYVEGESHITDLLMTLASNMTFRDMIGLVMGFQTSVNHLSSPLRSFLRRVLSLGEGQPDRASIDAGTLRFVDQMYPQLVEMAQEANVRDGIDFAETLHTYLEARVGDLVAAIFAEGEGGDFSGRVMPIVNRMLGEMVVLGQHCFTDSQVRFFS